MCVCCVDPLSETGASSFALKTMRPKNAPNASYNLRMQFQAYCAVYSILFSSFFLLAVSNFNWLVVEKKKQRRLLGYSATMTHTRAGICLHKHTPIDTQEATQSHTNDHTYIYLYAIRKHTQTHTEFKYKCYHHLQNMQSQVPHNAITSTYLLHNNISFIIHYTTTPTASSLASCSTSHDITYITYITYTSHTSRHVTSRVLVRHKRIRFAAPPASDSEIVQNHFLLGYLGEQLQIQRGGSIASLHHAR
jgi:hypothetical protein